MSNTFEKPQKEGWENEKEFRKDAVEKFLQKNLASSKYDSLVELHISGSNLNVMEKVKKGNAKMIELNSFYQKGIAKQVHVVFDGEGTGHNIDIYISGGALEDLLNDK